MEQELRVNRWIRASWAAQQFNVFMVFTLNGLGKLDQNLILDDERLVPTLITSNSDDVDMEFTYHLMLSGLWVLGSYEVVRSMEQKTRSEVLLAQDLRDALVNLKYDFERVRIPLAKFEPPKRYKATDTGVAYPGVNTESRSVTWEVSKNVWISRRELSDKLLSLLEAMAR